MTTDAVPIRPTYGAIRSRLRLVAGALGLVAAICALVPRPPVRTAAAAMGLVGLALGGASAAWAVAERRRRPWVAVRPDGFVLYQGAGERLIGDDQVVRMTLERTPHFAEGRLTALTRRFRVWLATEGGRPEPMVMVNTYGAEVGDPLGPLVERIASRLLDRARAERQAGQCVLGEGWALDGTTLTLGRGKAAIHLALADLAAVDVIDGHVCLWARGQDAAVARVPLRAANAHLLDALLNEHLGKARPEEAESEPSHLGRLLFERRSDGANGWLLGGLALFCALIGLFLFPAGAGLLVVALLFWAFALALMAAAVHGRSVSFRCHAHGIYRKTFLDERRLRYLDVAVLTYQVVGLYTKHYHNGIYTGTSFDGLSHTLTLEPGPGQPGDPITYEVTSPQPDWELENLRDHIARAIARRMQAEVQAGRAVPWTAVWQFTREGLASSGGGRIPYAALERFSVAEGVCTLWRKGQAGAAVQLRVDESNFYPGFLLLNTLAPDLKGQSASAGDLPAHAIREED